MEWIFVVMLNGRELDIFGIFFFVLLLERWRSISILASVKFLRLKRLILNGQGEFFIYLEP